MTGNAYQKTEVMGLNLETGELTNYSKAPNQYDEPEGIFPDGKHTLVACDAHNPKGSQYIDIYKLALDCSGGYERITYLGKHPGYKGSNPVVSDDGRYIAFQYACLGDRTGVGRGILILDLKAREQMKNQGRHCPPHEQSGLGVCGFALRFQVCVHPAAQQRGEDEADQRRSDCR